MDERLTTGSPMGGGSEVDSTRIEEGGKSESRGPNIIFFIIIHLTSFFLIHILAQ